MLIGYARVSKEDQHLDLQKRELKEAGCEDIFEDKISGVKDQRPGLQALLDYVRKGDIIVVWRLDRLGRSLNELIALFELLNSKGIELMSLHESIDTSSSSGKLIFHIFCALAEFERNLIRDRTYAGLRAARARGRKGGRPKKLSQDKRSIAVNLYREKKYTVRKICHIMDISRPTLYKYVEFDRNKLRDSRVGRGDGY